jgi:hypothetical protein
MIDTITLLLAIIQAQQEALAAADCRIRDKEAIILELQDILDELCD